MINGRDLYCRRGASATAILGWVVAGVLLLVIGYLIGKGSPITADDPTEAQSRSTTEQRGTTPVSEPRRPASSADEPASTDGPVAAEPQSVSSEDVAEHDIPVEFDPPELDFDIVEPDAEMRGTVVVRNVGDEPLTIEQMVASCKCTTAEDLSGTVIPPGGSTEFTAVMEAPSYTGTKTEQIRFLFAGFGVRSYQLSAIVSRAVYADPAFLTVTDRYSGTFRLASLDNQPFRVLAVNGEEPIYVGSFDAATDKPKREYELVWDLTPYDPDTCLNDDGEPMPMWWVVETDHPRAPIVDIRVRHVPCTLIEPPQAGRLWVLTELREVIGELQPGASRDFSVSMKWLRDQRPTDQIGHVESESDQFTAELLDVTREGDVITAHIRVTASENHRGLIYGDLRLFGERFSAHSCGLKIIGRVAQESERHAAGD